MRRGRRSPPGLEKAGSPSSRKTFGCMHSLVLRCDHHTFKKQNVLTVTLHETSCLPSKFQLRKMTSKTKDNYEAVSL